VEGLLLSARYTTMNQPSAFEQTAIGGEGWGGGVAAMLGEKAEGR